MRASLRADLSAALKVRDRVAITALRSALAAIDNAEAVPLPPAGPADPADEEAGPAGSAGSGSEVDRRHLTDADVLAIVEHEIAERSDAAADYQRLGRDDLAERLRTEAAVLSRHLPPGR